ncbi:MAG: glycosyltransferase family 4 protein [Planctomycetes bacterium]|nr:glycosyltransferase family 4 protein [Planctomycetota bacterium]
MTPIIVLTSSFPRFPGDAAGGFVADLAEGFVAQGYRMHHVAPAARGAPVFEEFAPDVFVHRVEGLTGFLTRRLAYGDGMGVNAQRQPWLLLGVPGLLRAFRRQTRRLIRETRSRRLISHWSFPAGVVASDLARRQRLRHLAIAHGGGVQALARGRITRRWLQNWVDGAGHIAFVSEDLRQKATAALGRELRPFSSVEAMGIRTADFRPSGRRAEIRAELAIDPRRRMVLFLGRLIALKGADVLIRAAADFPDLTVVVAGEGPERGKLAALAKKSGVDLRLLGAVNRSRVPQLLDAADLFVQPGRLGAAGRSEGAPVSILEAMAAGCPIIASRSGGVAELLRHRQDALLVEPGSVEELAAAMRKIITQPALDLRLAGSALERVREHDYTRVAERLAAKLEASRRLRP